MNINNARPKFYTPNEVSIHSSQKDHWVSFLGKVYNLTPLLAKHQGDVLLKPIIACGGKDISHWFDKKTKDIRMYIDPVTKCQFPYTPFGRVLHTPPLCPRTDWANDFGRPWWKNEGYCIGMLSQKTRKIRIVNTLTSQEQILEEKGAMLKKLTSKFVYKMYLNIDVCCEENMNEIQDRYFLYNSHAASYTWKYDGKNLDMLKTLEENNVTDESENFYKLGLDEDHWLPAIHLYFNDDLSEA